MENKIDWRIVGIVVLCITLLEAIALFKGINGVLLTTVLMLLAGIAGKTMPQWKLK